jgi:hypothetical protein
MIIVPLSTILRKGGQGDNKGGLQGELQVNYQTPFTIALQRGMRIVIFWGQGEESRGTFIEIRASQNVSMSVVAFNDEDTRETDSIPLNYIHHIEKVGE